MKTSASARLALSVGLLSVVDHASAFWRLPCMSSIGLARIDPLMAFDKPGNHVHSLKGGSALSATANGSDLLNSQCTSCGVKEDKSAYWTPALYFVGADGKTEIVPEMPPHKTYYFVEKYTDTSGRSITPEPFPAGFSMIAGNALKRNSSLVDEGALKATDDPQATNPKAAGPWPQESQEQLAERAIGFNCLNYNAPPEPSRSRHSLPSKDWLDAHCPHGLRLELLFQSCWNGELDGGKTHKSHVAFPTTLMGGDCPKGYDRRLPILFYETIVAIQNFQGKAGQFVLANGDPTGYGYHGDFIAAWEGDSLKNAIGACAEGNGDVEACSAFTILPNDDQMKCQLQDPLPAQIANEDTRGPVDGLPGRVAIQSGPEQATINLPSGAASVAPDATTSSIAKAPVVSQSSAASSAEAAHTPNVPPAALHPGAGAVFAEKQGQQLVAASPTVPASSSAITPPPAASPLAAGASVVTTKYWTDGQEVHQVVEVEVETTVTQTSMPPAKRSVVADAAGHKRRHHHHHHAANAHGIGGRRI